MSKELQLTPLTKKHRLFVEAYSGDVISAMLAAGFTGAPNYLKFEGERLLSNPVIVEAIKERSRYMAKTFQVIADRDERMAFLTNVMRNEDPHYKEERDINGVPIPQGNIAMQNRLKAVELLGKAHGDFVENINMNANLSITDLVMQSYKVEESIEDIEAEYYRVQEAQEVKTLPEPDSGPITSLGDFL